MISEDFNLCKFHVLSSALPSQHLGSNSRNRRHGRPRPRSFSGRRRRRHLGSQYFPSTRRTFCARDRSHGLHRPGNPAALGPHGGDCGRGLIARGASDPDDYCESLGKSHHPRHHVGGFVRCRARHYVRVFDCGRTMARHRLCGLRGGTSDFGGDSQNRSP